MTWGKSTKAKTTKKASLHGHKKMKLPSGTKKDPWKHIGEAKGQK